MTSLSDAMSTRQAKRMGVRDFALFARKYGIDPTVARAVMILWRDYMVLHLTGGRRVYQEHVGIYKLTKRRAGKIRSLVPNAPIPPENIYVTFKSATRLRNAIKKKFNQTENEN